VVGQTGIYKDDFQSIPRTFWWALVTMTTVGYGDISPITAMGRFVAVFTMFSGIIIVALPITVIGANFEKQFEKHFFADQLVEEVSKEDGSVDYTKMLALMRTLDLRGNLQIPLPENEAELAELVSEYDVQRKGRLDSDDWACFIMDNVCEACEFNSFTVNKLVVDVCQLRSEVVQLRAALDQQRATCDAQHEQLRALLLGQEEPQHTRSVRAAPPPPDAVDGARALAEVVGFADAERADRLRDASGVIGGQPAALAHGGGSGGGGADDRRADGCGGRSCGSAGASDEDAAVASASMVSLSSATADAENNR
jgi:hypothetical protein